MYTMLFSSSDLKELSKDVVIIAGANIAGFLVGKVVRKVLDNEKEIERLKIREKTRDIIHDWESELKK